MRRSWTARVPRIDLQHWCIGASLYLVALHPQEERMPKTPDEDGRLNVRLPREFLRRLKIEVAKREMTLQDAAREALEAWIRQGGRVR